MVINVQCGIMGMRLDDIMGMRLDEIMGMRLDDVLRITHVIFL